MSMLRECETDLKTPPIQIVRRTITVPNEHLKFNPCVAPVWVTNKYICGLEQLRAWLPTVRQSEALLMAANTGCYKRQKDYAVYCM